MIFSRYMEAWLYGDEGYYRRFRPIGKEGDFYTAVSTSPFFGASIAHYLCGQIQKGIRTRETALVEIGAHRGYLMADMIQWLYTCDPALLESMHFVIVERQEHVQQAQREYFSQRFGDAVRLEQVSDLEALHLEDAFFVANELFDAFPCELYIEGKIAQVKDEAILWQDAPENLQSFARSHGMNKGEIAQGYEAFARRLAAAAKQSEFVTFDYGERYARNDFSIRVYTEHAVYPLFDENLKLSEHFGRSDITYDVNFEHLMQAFASAGMRLESFKTQGRALIDFGIIDLLEQFARQTSQENYQREADKIKNLIAPNIMGERFKMIHWKKTEGHL